MFINVKKNGEIKLTAVGSDHMDLLKRLADGVVVQAYDDSKVCSSSIILVPVLLPDKQERSSS